MSVETSIVIRLLSLLLTSATLIVFRPLDGLVVDKFIFFPAFSG
ncbi:hypothetical protein [Bartonella apihabitans]